MSLRDDGEVDACNQQAQRDEHQDKQQHSTRSGYPGGDRFHFSHGQCLAHGSGHVDGQEHQEVERCRNGLDTFRLARCGERQSDSGRKAVQAKARSGPEQ